jgi:hypothetical protein
MPEPEVVLFPIASIQVPASRQRNKAEADPALIASIETDGLLHPIIIHADGRLVAGERRLDAHRKLGKTTIRATVLENLAPLQAFRIELTENLARKQLSWQEEVKAVGEYHNLRMAHSVAGWTQMGTATDLGVTQGHVSKLLAVFSELAEADVAACPTLQGAFNLLTARADRARIAAQSRGIDFGGAALAALPPYLPIGTTKAERTAALLNAAELTETTATTLTEIDRQIADIAAGKLASAALLIQQKQEVCNDLVINADFIDWAEHYTGARFDVLHVDFPYGKGFTGARTRRTGKAHIAPIYLDDPDVYFELVAGLLAVQDQIVFPAAHCLFWFDMQYYDWTCKQFQAAGWQLVQPFPLIWTKGYTGIAADTKRRPRHCYETALLFSRGDRKLSKLENDHFECALEETKLHVSQKPLLMLKKFLSLIVDEHTALLDPTCGSGGALVAALQLKAARVLGVELDSNNADIARFLLQRRAPDEAA